MGLGPLTTVSLAEAREEALKCRKLLQQDVDPILERERLKKERALADARRITFEECANRFLASMDGSWKNEKHRAQWRNTLQTYAYPVIGKCSTQDISSEMIQRILAPIWNTKTETASRVRGRVESVIDFATANELRVGDNPARWRGHLDKIFPQPSKIKNVDHHAALPFCEVGQFVKDLRAKESLSAKALELLILTALRPGELVGCKWSEINLDEQSWTVPAPRMKKKKEHRIPLSARAIEIFNALSEFKVDEYVFPGLKHGFHMTTASLLKLAKEMRPELEITSHGFRSTFRDWAAEISKYQNEVVEMALAHTIKNKTESAYRRGDLFLKRRPLMNEWAEYCGRPQKLNRVIQLDSFAK